MGKGKSWGRALRLDPTIEDLRGPHGIAQVVGGPGSPSRHAGAGGRRHATTWTRGYVRHGQGTLRGPGIPGAGRAARRRAAGVVLVLPAREGRQKIGLDPQKPALPGAA